MIIYLTSCRIFTNDERARCDMAKVDPLTLKKMIEEMGVSPLDAASLKGYAQELEGLVEVIGRLDDLDLSQEEPSHLFVNGGH